MPIGSNILAGSSGKSSSYHIEQSVGIDGDWSLADNHTVTSTNTWTYSFWVKMIYDHDDRDTRMSFGGSDTCHVSTWGYVLRLENGTSNISNSGLERFRDMGAWYHIHVGCNGATRGIEVRVNGKHISQMDAAQRNIDNFVVNARNSSGGARAKGWMAEAFYLTQFVDYDQFGEFDDNGIWIPKDAAGTITFGAEDVYLKFDDKTNLGKDSSGNSNNMTVVGTVTNNSAAAYANQPLCLDTPTNNWSTYNAAYSQRSSSFVQYDFARGLQARTHDRINPTTIPLTSGKWYWEVIRNADDRSNAGLGSEDMIQSDDQADGTSPAHSGMTAVPVFGGQFLQWSFAGALQKVDSAKAFGTSLSSNLEICNVAVDLDARKIWFGKDNTWFNSGDPANGTNPSWDGNSGGDADGEWDKIIGGAEGNALVDAVHKFWIPYTNNTNTNWTAINMGQAYVEGGQREPDPNASTGAYSFKYTPPSGFKAICTKNLPAVDIEKPSDHCDVAFWTANQSSRTVSSLDFRPDLMWFHQTTGDGFVPQIVDSVNGKGVVASFAAAAAATGVTDCVTDFTDNGFILGADANDRGINGETGTKNSAWCWKAGGEPTATNTAAAGQAQTAGSVKVDGANGSFAHGTIAVQAMSVNTTAGFSIVKYLGTGTAGTIPHGLGRDPQFIVFRRIDGDPCVFFHSDLLALDRHGAFSSSSANATGNPQMFDQNSTNLTNNTFHVGTNSAANPNNSMVTAYCWAPIKGYSMFGHFSSTTSGSGSTPDQDNEFVYTGFCPELLIIKKQNDGSGNFMMYSHKSDTGHHQQNYKDLCFFGDSPGASIQGDSRAVDFFSNGFKIRNSLHDLANNGNMIFMAWAAHPFGGSNVNPGPAI